MFSNPKIKSEPDVDANEDNMRCKRITIDIKIEHQTDSNDVRPKLELSEQQEEMKELKCEQPDVDDHKDGITKEVLPSSYFPEISLDRKTHEESKMSGGNHILTNEKKFCCDTCKKSFTRKISLTNHMNVHNNSRPYSCWICKKTYSLKSYLASHLRTHTGERPYKCDVCKKKFTRKSTLISHIRLHTGEKPYKCSVCKKLFNDRGNFKRHQENHVTSVGVNGARGKFGCNMCEMKFTQKLYLECHQRSTHRGDKLFTCDICDIRFAQKSHLACHLLIHNQNHKIKIKAPL